THWKSPPLVGIFGASPHVGRKRECVVVEAAPSNRSPRGKFPSIREKNREFCKFEGVATTCLRKNTRHYRRFSAKFPVRIEPGILFVEPGIFKCENGKTRRARALPGRNGNADSRITDNVKR